MEASFGPHWCLFQNILTSPSKARARRCSSWMSQDCSAKLCPQTYLPCIVSNTQNIRHWWWQGLFWRGDTVIDWARRAFFLPLPHSCNVLVEVVGRSFPDWSVGVPKLSETAALKQLSLFQAVFCDSKARGVQINEVKLFFVTNIRFFFYWGENVNLAEKRNSSCNAWKLKQSQVRRVCFKQSMCLCASICW